FPGMDALVNVGCGQESLVLPPMDRVIGADDLAAKLRGETRATYGIVCGAIEQVGATTVMAEARGWARWEASAAVARSSARRAARAVAGAVRCGAPGGAVHATLQLPAVTGMHAENPGVDLYRRHLYIVQTGGEAARMLDEVRRVVALGLKLARAESVGAPAVD